MKTAIAKWFVRSLSPETTKYLANLAEPRPVFHGGDNRLVTTLGAVDLWECSSEQVKALRADSYAHRRDFEVLVQLEGSLRIEPFHNI